MPGFMPSQNYSFGGPSNPLQSHYQIERPPSVMDQYQAMAGLYNPLPPGQGTYNLSAPPPMRQAPQPPPMRQAPAPQQQPPPMRSPAPAPMMGMYQGGIGEGPLGQAFMTSYNGNDWNRSQQNPSQTQGWSQTGVDSWRKY